MARVLWLLGTAGVLITAAAFGLVPESSHRRPALPGYYDLLDSSAEHDYPGLHRRP